MQYNLGTSSVQARMRTTNQAHRQYKQVDHHISVQEGTTQKYFPMNESLLLLIYQMKMVSIPWRAAKTN